MATEPGRSTGQQAQHDLGLQGDKVRGVGELQGVESQTTMYFKQDQG